MTGEDLGYRPDLIQKAKFEYNPLGQVFKKGLTTDDKSEGLLKRLKNIEDMNDNQLIAIEIILVINHQLKMGSTINHHQLKIEKLVIQENLSLEMQMVMKQKN